VNVNIFPMALGIDNCYVVQGEGAILIDGGAPNQADRFAKSVAKLPVRPWEIKLIVATHEHPDHIGSAKEIKGLTGAAIAMHHLGKDCLEQGVVRRPSALSAWGRLLLKLMPPPAPGSVPPTGVDLVLGDEAHSLAGYGIPGKVIHTPGHSPGSIRRAIRRDRSACCSKQGMPLSETWR
jgi:glyoxylase-like metal-dependent hydrolase (beta-lactamase superfamily II)